MIFLSREKYTIGLYSIDMDYGIIYFNFDTQRLYYIKYYIVSKIVVEIFVLTSVSILFEHMLYYYDNSVTLFNILLYI